MSGERVRGERRGQGRRGERRKEERDIPSENEVGRGLM